jgi:sulfhydrogenase subunit gamma (sulfur reductase)
MENIYQPHIMIIDDITVETPDVKTFRLKFQDPELEPDFSFKAGQFGEFSLFGEGEATFCIASSPTRKGYIECTVKRTGKVTDAMHKLDVGDPIGFRGPYGNWFPIDELKGKDLIFIGGGIGLAPLRSLIRNCLDLREDFGKITILYGSRTVADLVYKQELAEWEKRDDITLIKTVDPGGEGPDWNGRTGFVPVVMRDIYLSSDNSTALTCGPPIMIKFVIQGLDSMGFSPTQIITTLEMKMKCGLGKCGRCNIGKYYVCKDGPVFTYAQIYELPNEF